MPKMERQTNRAENLRAEVARIGMSLTQAAAAIVAPLAVAGNSFPHLFPTLRFRAIFKGFFPVPASVKSYCHCTIGVHGDRACVPW